MGREKPPRITWRDLAFPVSTVGLLIAATVLPFGDLVLAMGPAFLFLVALSAYVGGIFPGLISSASTLGYGGLALSSSSRPLELLGDGILEFAALTAAALAIAGMVGTLRSRSLALPRERAERVGAERERVRVTELVDGVDAVLWEADGAFGYRQVGRGAERLFGYPAEGWLLDPHFVAQHIDPRDREQVARVRDELRGGGQDRVRHEYRWVTADGNALWVDEIAEAVYDRKGRVGGFRGRTVDITPQKAAEGRLTAVLAALRSSRNFRSLEELAAVVIEPIRKSLEWDLGALWVMGSPGEDLRTTRVWPEPAQDLEDFASAIRGMRFAPGEDLPGRVAAQGEALWVEDLAADPVSPRAPYADKAGLHSAFAFAVRGDSGTLAVLEFFTRSTQSADLVLLGMMKSLGDDLSNLLVERREHEALDRRKRILELQSEGALDGILVVSEEGKIISFNQSFVEMWGIPAEVLNSRSDDAALKSIKGKLADPEEFLAKVAHLYANPNEDSSDEVALRDGRVFDRWSTPLRADDGVYYGRAWYFHDVTERKLAERRLSESRNRFAFLDEVGRALTAALEYEETLSAVLRLAVPRLADWVAIDLIDETRSISRVAGEHVDATRRDLVMQIDPRRPDLRGPLTINEANLYPEVTDEVLAELAPDPTQAGMLHSLGCRSMMILPLTARGRWLGAITLATAGSGRTYGPDDLALAQAVGLRASLALDNARLHRERSRTAQTLQESLLPRRLPEIPGLLLAARYHAAGIGNEVGGDFYDVFSYGRNRWALVIGDVSGKGAAAAAITALVRYTVRAEALQEHEPRRILSALNDSIIEQSNVEQFCTIVYTRLELTKEGVRLTIICAGHPSPIVVRADGRLERVRRSGSALGILEGIDLEEQLIDLWPGDLAVFFTDGATDVRSRAKAFTDEDLEALVGECAGLDAEEVAKRIEATLVEPGPPEDDIAILVLQVPARPGSGH